MIKSTPSISWFLSWSQDTQISKLKRHVIRVVGPFLFLVTSFFLLTFSAHAQPSTCGKVECTSNDVRPVSAYLSGPGGAAIDCGAADPFLNAELHIVVSSNAVRQGVAISADLNVTNGSNPPNSYFISNLFCQNLRSDAPNDFAFNLTNTLSGVQCQGETFSLANVFIAWGTGQNNGDFCQQAGAPCPQTPAKCRFQPGEIITVTVKLDVDFTAVTGNCQDKTNLTAYFSPSFDGQHITAPVTYNWDFGDGIGTATTASNDGNNGATSYTYGQSGTYTVILTATDASDPAVTASASHTVTVNDCENSCIPPDACSDDLTLCATAGTDPATAVFDLTTSKCNTNVTGWFTTSDFAFANQISDPTKFTAQDGTTVYGLIQNDCDFNTATVTLHVNPTPTVSATPATQTVCSGTAITDIVITNPNNVNGTTFSWTRDNKQNLPGIPGTGTTSTISGTLTNSTNAPITTTFTITATAGDCSSTTSVTVTVNPLPTVSAGSDVSICNGKSTTLTASGATTFTWSPSDGLSATTGSTVTATPTTTTTYTVTGTDGNSCTNTAQVTVTVNPVPSCTISNTTTSGATKAGVGVPVHFSGPNAPSGSTYNYAWSFSANTAGATFTGGTTTATTQAVVVTTTSTGSYTLSLTVTDVGYSTSCTASCTYSMTINTDNAYYTVTQGFYGNTGGKICTPSGTLYTSGSKGTVDGLIITCIKNMLPSQKLALGIVANNRTFTMGYTSTEEKNLITYLPATQAPSIILAQTGSNNNTNITTNLPKIYNKKISDVLLGQTITLDLNVFIPGNTLGGFVLQNGYLTTQKADISTCPATKVITCSKDATAISSLQIATSAGLQSWIASGTKTVNDLLALASNALGGGPLPAGVSLTDINNAVNVINTSFDGERFFIGYYATQKSCANPPTINRATNAVTEVTTPVDKPTVSTYPNPFNDQVKFVIQSPVSGKATLEVFNMMGQKIRTVFTGQLFAGLPQTVQFNIPYTSRVNMIYVLKVNGEQLVGKLISVKQ